MFDTYADIFEKRAAEYHHAMLRSPHARDAEFHAVLDPIREASSGLVCDMPSGGGYLADYLRPGMDYLAIDPATDFFVEWRRPLQRLLAKITDVPLADGSVDYIVSLAGLHHEPSLPRVFGEMRRLLRPVGGRARGCRDRHSPARFLNGFVADHCPLGHDGRFLDEHCAPMLKAANFALADDRMIEVPGRSRALMKPANSAAIFWNVGAWR